ncbi:MAG: aspartate--tRNA ligase [Candidatus Dadabacteria bacterium]|nr:MAG: aspartate--tRNA ligase [Candidatus Dadabacteria bacterium]
MKYLKSKYRTHLCSELRLADQGKQVTLSGWISRKRDHGGVVFVDLRDNYGITQVVFHDELREKIQKLRLEAVISVTGKVLPRGEGLENPKLKTGEIEVHCDSFEVLGGSDVLPFQVAEDDNAPEAIRLKYRFLELRRDKLHSNILFRTEFFKRVREIMQELGFYEFQTPILTSSSPEGARDFIVPSRLHPGKFFALPQAPQQFKQLIMVAGFDRYFQLAPCFRDEDARADRSPGEFYQIDIEMSFVEQQDVFAVNEELMSRLYGSFSEWKLDKPPFKRIRYEDAILTYGTDKPDLRNPLRIDKVNDVFKDTEFRVFRTLLERGEDLFAIKVEGADLPSRKYFDDTIKEFTAWSNLGLAYLVIEHDGFKGSIAKFISEREVTSLKAALSLDGPGIVFIAGGEKQQVLPWLGKLRDKLGADFNLIEEGAFRFCWITDYPLYERGENGEIEFSHNPFSMPQGGLEALNSSDPLEIYAYQYDLVCNGLELGSGAIRNHLPEVMYRAFEIAGYPREAVDEKFGAMIRAFRFGTPPHGGIAFGIERMIMQLVGEAAIREVIMFPLAQTGEDLMMGAPSEVSEKQLEEVHIRVVLPEKHHKK